MGLPHTGQRPTGAKRGLGAQVYPALPVAVIVVFTFLGEELDGFDDPRFRAGNGGLPPGPQGFVQGSVVHFHLEYRGFPAQLFRGMGIGIGDYGEAVQGGERPVHGRIRGKAGFHGGYVGGEIAVTGIDGVEPRLGPQGGKPGGPDVGGDEQGPFVRIQEHGQEVP